MNREKKPRQERGAAVRRKDIEPYTALRWVGTLFKAAAVFLLIAIVGEFVTGLHLEGWRAMPILLGELARTTVLAVVLWGGGDLVRLLTQLGHDIRAQRILLCRIASRLPDGARLRQRWLSRGGAPTLHAGLARRRRDATQQPAEPETGVEPHPEDTQAAD